VQKLVSKMSAAGLLKAVRGARGGLKLARPPRSAWPISSRQSKGRLPWPRAAGMGAAIAR
jgi:hypothetical protein